MKNGTTGLWEEKPSQLEMFIYTWSRCVDGFRKKAQHSVHDMRIAARLKCTCSDCVKYGMPKFNSEIREPQFDDDTGMVPAGAPENENEPF